MANRWELSDRPALDGLRGIAIALVLASHLSLNPGIIRSLGPVGVSLFFALSGFLITALLLAEWDQRGAVSLHAFFGRRARRLLPGMVTCVAVVAVVGLLFGADFVGVPLVIGALTYSANWIAMEGGGEGSALGHMWSLAIEEQFYLIWPVVFLLLVRLGRRGMCLGLAAGITTSALLCIVLYQAGWQRVYYGSDTRAAGLLLGCLLAVLVHGRVAPRGAQGFAAVGVGLIIASAAAPLPFVFMLAPILVPVVAVGVIYCSVGRRRVTWLEWWLLRYLGRRAYGLYLWHYPVAIAAERLLDRPGVTLMALVVLPLSVALSEVSWHMIEKPFLRGNRRPHLMTGAASVADRTSHRTRATTGPAGSVAI